MKIITYNVNGLRAAVSKGLPEWLAKEQPDVLCLQETKLRRSNILRRRWMHWDTGIICIRLGRKGIAESPS